MVKSIEAKLNVLLKYYRDNRTHNDPEYQIAAEKVLPNLIECEAKLEQDGFMAWKELEDGKKLRYITVDGIKHLKKGGYNPSAWTKFKLSISKLNTIATVIGIIGGIYGLYCGYLSNERYEEAEKLKKEIKSLKDSITFYQTNFVERTIP